MAEQTVAIGYIKGATGATGATGAQGETGTAATITVGSTTTSAYGTTARVTNSGTTSAAVLDFVIPQGAPGETVTDMANLTLSALTEPSTSFPVPAIGEIGSVIFGKITKWFSDMYALVATKQDTITRTVTTGIYGDGILEIYGHVAVLQYESGSFASGTAVPSAYCPTSGAVWGYGTVASGDSNIYRIGVRTDGAVLVQTSGGTQKTSLSDLRGQVVWTF